MSNIGGSHMALHGVRVLDFTRVLAGPHATRMLCDLGAEVIKVEGPDGDITRYTMPRVNGIATYYAQQNVGKRNISIDLGTAEGRELAASLAERCDVVIENFRPGVMDRLGLGPEVLRARHPGLVYMSISGYGQSGPLRGKRAYNVVISAECGLTQFQGDARGGDYQSDPSDHADMYTAMAAAVATLGALVHRERTGEGAYIDLSMAHTLLYASDHLHDQLFDGEVPDGVVRSFGTPDYLVFSVRNDDRVAVSGNPADRGTFEMMSRSLGRTDLLDDERFGSMGDRLARLSELKRELLQSAQEFPDASALIASCDRNGLAAGIVQSGRAMAESEWAEQRKVLRTVPDRVGGSFRVPSAPWHLHSRGGSAAPDDGDTGRGYIDRVAYRGEDNRAVCAELLGLSDHDIDRLESVGALTARAPRS